MGYFDFSIYNGTKQYFKLYDVYIKVSGNNKEDLYYKLCINNSSYRRARETEQRVGKEIIYKLSKYFCFKVPKESTIIKLQDVANRIYSNLYFKIYDTCVDYGVKALNSDENIIKMAKLTYKYRYLAYVIDSNGYRTREWKDKTHIVLILDLNTTKSYTL